MKIQIGVIGPSKTNYPESLDKAEALEKASEQIGTLLAREGAIVLTGGCSGVMESVSRGADTAGGIGVGTPGPTRLSSNEFVNVEILTPISVGDFLFAGIPQEQLRNSPLHTDIERI